jgi:hypothetical protein
MFYFFKYRFVMDRTDEETEFDTRQRKEIFLLSITSRSVGGGTFLLSNDYWGLLRPGLELPERKADHSTPSIAEVKN